MLLWDILAWALVLFPLFLGGVWIQQPGLKFELTELAVPVAIVALLGWILAHYFRAPIRRASAWRFGARLWDAWRGALERQPRRALLLGWFAFGSIWAFAALRRHWALGTHALDFGIFQSAAWNLVHGNGYVSAVKDGMNLFRDHQSPFFWLEIGVYRLFPWAGTFLVLQSFILAAGAPALYWLGRQYSRDPATKWAWAALPMLYWAYLPTRSANLFDFHPETAMLPLFLWSVVAFQGPLAGWVPKLRAALLFFLLMATKESAGIVITAQGLSWLLGSGPVETRSRTRILGGACVFLGPALFFFDIKVVPGLAGGPYPYLANFSAFGGGLGDLLLAPFTQPSLFFGRLFQLSRLKFLFWTLAPLSFLPLANPRAFLVAAVAYIPLFLDGSDHRMNLGYYYSIEPSAGLFFAMPGALLWAQNRAPLRLRARLPLVLLFFALFCFGRGEAYAIRKNAADAHAAWVRDEALPSIRLGSAAASGALVPHLTRGPWVRHLPVLEIAPGLREAAGGAKVQCVIFDPSANNYPLDREVLASFETGAFDPEYTLEYECEGFKVFRLASGGSCLEREPLCRTKGNP